ncbi:hypothetical protein COV42_01890 [Candidatus Campbellbacteria bacterium CG11_big_fil_rev_8_21_14_0_20_44_21]|uniref:Uncharacterized protein n=1 Tax=Candidatus Campbellbacteria bacterium CG22_combo_CG10-13_8_21_14_all_43_18 TaxID=1974530 RepID=A0A2H0DXC7_9BACT|nr:MAG: hypothetical protein COW82_03135 [Candidatus Campbellbacteria bacterium CG22_combo_CG10-13_8_21_14_all_43_18]PIR24231.1 MAG: hypothetical protein COV42_01890 [Candidatus Campbellbacteria bacterium CG11_big_fil_rev_8_21_14_0_20_44_21]
MAEGDSPNNGIRSFFVRNQIPVSGNNALVKPFCHFAACSKLHAVAGIIQALPETDNILPDAFFVQSLANLGETIDN